MHLALPPHRGASRALALALSAALCAPSLLAQAQQKPQRTALRAVRLGLDAELPQQTLLLEGGRIAAVLAADAELPPGCRVIECEGHIVLPAFVDAFTATGCKTPEPVVDRDVPVPQDEGPRVDMRAANRKGLQPAFRTVDALDFSKDALKPWRENGFGALLCAPDGELLAGTSALVTVREAAPRDLVLLPEVFAHGAFDASGSGYPSTTMAYMAQLRQFFMDAQHLVDLELRFSAGRPGPRPPFDADLQASLPILAGIQRLACEADSAEDIELWIRLADQFGFEIEIVGGGEAWRRTALLAERRIPLVLTLDWGEEAKDPHEKKKDAKKSDKPDKSDKDDKDDKDAEDAEDAEDADAQDPEATADAPQQESKDEPAAKAEAEPDPNVFEDPMALREERRRLWLEKRDCALRLAEAGVPFTFGSANGNAGELLKKVRTLVEAGLDESVALEALTSNAAVQIGVSTHLGALEVGRDATLAVWSASPFQKKSKLTWLFVDGFEYEFKLDAEDAAGPPPDEGVDATGEWTLSYVSQGGTRRGAASLTMAEDGTITGTLSSESPDGSMNTTDVEGRVSGSTLKLKGAFVMGEMEIAITLEATLAGDTLDGTSVGKGDFGEFKSTVTGTRSPKEIR